MSHVWNGEALCSIWIVGESESLMVRFFAGVDVPRPMRPVLSTPIDSVLVQSAPPQRPPAAETKSEKNVSGAVLKGGRTEVSRMFGGTTAPFRTVKTPLCTRLPSFARNSYEYWPSPSPSTRSMGLRPAANVSVTTFPSGLTRKRTTASREQTDCHSTLVAVVTRCAANALSGKSATKKRTGNRERIRMILPPFSLSRERQQLRVVRRPVP